jgi:hypothetical protein
MIRVNVPRTIRENTRSTPGNESKGDEASASPPKKALFFSRQARNR